MHCNKIAIDFHGVLTDGKINIAADGTTPYESLHVKDISAMRQLIALGYEVYVVTSSSSPIIDAFCKKVGCIKIESRIKKNIFPAGSYIAIGDSSFDYEFLRDAYWGLCPADAEDVLLNHASITRLKTKGGHGCVYELLQRMNS